MQVPYLQVSRIESKRHATYPDTCHLYAQLSWCSLAHEEKEYGVHPAGETVYLILRERLSC
jgi:hypothetical protein